jgi:hypothetical protein
LILQSAGFAKNAGASLVKDFDQLSETRLLMSGLAMPKPDDATLRRRDEIVADMRIIVPGEGVVDAANSRCVPSRATA